MLVTVLAAMALAPPQVGRGCRDDRGQDRCAPAKQAKVRELFRVRPIESFSGSTMRRVFFVDGYGRDVVAIEFLREAQKDAVVRVHFPADKGSKPVAPIEQDLTGEDWRQILDASLHFDKVFASNPVLKSASRREKSENADIVLCLHSWVYWAEAIDPEAKPRSAISDACNKQPVEQFAWAAARVARQAIPSCAALDERYSRNDATLLGTCSILTGDRLAAAEVWNQGAGLRNVDTPGGMDDLPAYDLLLDFQGTKRSHREAKEFWRSLMKQERSPRFSYYRIHGLSADRVIVSGDLIRDVAEDKYELADIELSWQKDGGLFHLESIKVGPYLPVTD